MDLVDEEDDLPFALGDLIDDALESLLELTLILRTCDQGTHIEGIDLLRAQVLGHITSDDTEGKSLGNGCLPYPWLPDEDRVILRSTGKDL